MDNLFTSQPTGFIALVVSLVGIAGAMTAAVVTQVMGRRRDRADYLLEKLEELFRALSEARTAADGRLRKGREFVRSPPPLTGDPNEHIHLSRDMPLERKIKMLVEFYFDELEDRLRDLAALYPGNVDIFRRFSNGNTVSAPDVYGAHKQMLNRLKAFENELILNRDRLVREPGLKRKRYTKVLPEEDKAPAGA